MVKSSNLTREQSKLFIPYFCETLSIYRHPPLEFFVNGPSGRVTIEAIKVAAACFSLSLLLGSFAFFALGKLFYGTIIFVS
jgi:hypothetical protein